MAREEDTFTAAQFLHEAACRAHDQLLQRVNVPIQQAAPQSDVVFIFDLGMRRYYGRGIPQNRQIAANLFQLAAIHSTEKDATYIHAAQWYERTANLYDRDTQFQLGLWYLEGHCVQKNIIKAFCHLSNAIQQGHIEAHLRLGQILSYDPEYALPFYFYAATNGNAFACYLVGKYHLLQKNETEALQWFHKACEYGGSPLHFAGAENEGEELEEDIQVVRFALAHGFNVVARDEQKNSPYRLALDRTHLRIAALLQERIVLKLAERRNETWPTLQSDTLTPIITPKAILLMLCKHLEITDLLTLSLVCKFFWRIVYDGQTALGKKFDTQCQKYPHRFSLWNTSQENAQAATAGLAKSASTSFIA